MITVANNNSIRDNEITVNGCQWMVSDELATTIVKILNEGLSSVVTKDTKTPYKYKDVDVKSNIGIQEVKTIDGKKFYRIQNKGALYRGKGKQAFNSWIKSLDNIETASCQFDNGRKLITWTAYGFKTKKACQTFIDSIDKVFTADELNAIEF